MTHARIEELSNSLVAFHVGRGGRFYNQGHVTYSPYVRSFDELVSAKEWFFINFEDEDGKPLADDEWTLTDCDGHIYLEGRDEIEAETGRVEWDGDYDTDYVRRIKDCDEEELEMIYESGEHHSLSNNDLIAICCYYMNWNRAEDWSLEGRHLKLKTIEGKEFETEIEAEDFEAIRDEVEDWLFINNFDEKGRQELAERVANEF